MEDEKNVCAIPVVRISPYVHIRKKRPEKGLSETFYPNADDIRQYQGVNIYSLEELLHYYQINEQKKVNLMPYVDS